MRYTKLFGIGAILVIVGAVFAMPLAAHAQSFRSGDNVTVTKGEVVDSTLYAAGRTVDIGGDIDGDVFCGGQTVTISGTVRGDVVCAAQTITLTGKVDGDVRLAAQTTTFSGTVTRNASVVGQTFTVSSDAVIGGDLSIAGQDATLSGIVGRDVAFSGEKLTINGQVGRKLTGATQQLTVGTKATLKEGGNYTSYNSAQIAEGATVGELKRTTPKESPANGPNWAWRLYIAVALLFAAFLLVVVKPRLFHQASQTAIDNPLKASLVGLATSIAVPVALILLMFTVVGIPLALFLMVAWALVLAISSAFAAYYLGRLLLARTQYTHALLYVLLGGVILVALSWVPILNVIASLLSLWLGLGMIALHSATNFGRPNYHIKEAAKVKK